MNRSRLTAGASAPEVQSAGLRSRRSSVASALRKATRLVLATVMFGAVFEIVSPASPVHAATNKITICHRTHATTNPYRRITVNKSSVVNANGHSNSSHDEYSTVLFPSGKPQPNVYNPSVTYTPSPQKLWGDIIPNFLTDGSSYSGTDYGLNFTRTEVTNNNWVNLPDSNAGKDIYNNTGSYAGYCKARTAHQFCEDEIASGRTLAQCQDDLNDQESNDDKASKDACGGSFTGCTLDKMSTISVAASSATCASATSYELTGSLSLGTTSGTAVFEYSTSATLATYSSSATATKTGTATYSATVTSLTAGTWYYRLVAITGSGDTEGRIESDVKSFTVSGQVCTAAVTTTVPGATTTTVAGATTTTVAGATTNTVAGATTTTVVAGSGSSLTAGKGGLIVTIWIDANRNGAKTAAEPYYPGVTCTAVGPGNATKTAVTDATGQAIFADLDPGAWRVSCELTDDSLEKVYDSDGTLNWTSDATVVAGKFSEFKYAAAGTAALDITGVRTDSVTVKWLGPDGAAGTEDDVTFVVKPTSGRVKVLGLAPGNYIVSATGNFDVEEEYIGASLAAGETSEVEVPSLSTTGVQNITLLLMLAALLIATGSVMGVIRRRAV